jgi:hypothetical protein
MEFNKFMTKVKAEVFKLDNLRVYGILRERNKADLEVQTIAREAFWWSTANRIRQYKSWISDSAAHILLCALHLDQRYCAWAPEGKDAATHVLLIPIVPSSSLPVLVLDLTPRKDERSGRFFSMPDRVVPVGVEFDKEIALEKW